MATPYRPLFVLSDLNHRSTDEALPAHPYEESSQQPLWQMPLLPQHCPQFPTHPAQQISKDLVLLGQASHQTRLFFSSSFTYLAQILFSEFPAWKNSFKEHRLLIF